MRRRKEGMEGKRERMKGKGRVKKKRRIRGGKNSLNRALRQERTSVCVCGGVVFLKFCNLGLNL